MHVLGKKSKTRYISGNQLLKHKSDEIKRRRLEKADQSAKLSKEYNQDGTMLRSRGHTKTKVVCRYIFCYTQ